MDWEMVKQLTEPRMDSARRVEIQVESVCVQFVPYPIYQPLRSGRICHKVNF